MHIPDLEKIAWRFVRYQSVNISTFLVDLAVVFIFTQFLGVQYLISVVIGFMTSGVIGFFWNRGWTFKVEMHFKRGLIVSFFVGAVAFCIILLITYVGVSLLGMNYLLARIVAAVFAALWSYIGDSFYTFKVHPFRNI